MFLLNKISALFNKRSSRPIERYNLARWCISINDNNWNVFLEKIVTDYESLLNGDSGQYWVNYGKPKVFNRNKLLGKYLDCNIDKVEELTLTNNDNSLMVSMNGLSFGYPYLREIMFVFSCENDLKDTFVNLSENLLSAVAVMYGYARTLTKEYEPASESRIKRTFGGQSIVVESYTKTWFIPPSLEQKIIKGVYPLNLVHTSFKTLDYFGSAIDAAKAMGQDLVLIKCSQTDLQEIQNAKTAIADYVRR